MRKTAFYIVIILITCLGCQSDDTDKPSFTGKIRAWQSREATVNAVQSDIPKFMNSANAGIFYRIGAIIDQYDLAPSPELSGDKWKTSAETIRDGGGDCEDLANYVMRILNDSCFIEYVDADIRNRVIRLDDESFHVVTVIYIGDETYEVDNLAIRDFESDHPVVVEYDLNIIF